MKKNVFLLGLSFLLVISASAQNLVPQQWKFITGDDPEYSKPDYDDSRWDNIICNDIWENQGYPEYDGFAWYRFSVIIPSSLKKKITKYGGMTLRLGKIDDADMTYFNGEKVGQNGGFPPSNVTAFNTQRAYTIPVDKILWDKKNIVAIRVYDSGGGGGVYGETIDLYLKDFYKGFTLSPEFEQENRIITNRKSAVFKVKVQNTFNDNFAGKLTVVLKTDFGEDVATSWHEIKVKSNSDLLQQFIFEDLKPGFYKATIQFHVDGTDISNGFVFGVDPEKIVSPPNSPNDLKAYWDRAKNELACIDPLYNVVKIDSLCTPSRDYYLVEMRSLGNVRVRGWYSTPTVPGKYPAVLHVPGYSSYIRPQDIYSANDFVSFGLNIRGHGNSQDNLSPGFPGYLLNQLHDKEMYIYRGAYMDCCRALDFLFTRPEVDTENIVVEGGSQGGALSFATAALNPGRIKLCAPKVPFLSDFEDYFEVANWPGTEFKAYVKNNPDIGWDKVYETLSYIDIKNLAGWIKAPVLMQVGLMDETCPPHINFAAYNQLNVPKEYVVYPMAGHGTPAEYHDIQWKWIKKQLGMD